MATRRGYCGAGGRRARIDQLGGDAEQQHSEQALEHVCSGIEDREESARHHARDPADSQHESRLQPNMSVLLLSPRPHRDHRQHREQRRRLGCQLVEPERKRERRHEENPSADAEEACQHAGEGAESDADRDLVHQMNSRTAIATSTPANASVSVRVASRCWRLVPASTPTVAGMPTSAA